MILFLCRIRVASTTEENDKYILFKCVCMQQQQQNRTKKGGNKKPILLVIKAMRHWRLICLSVCVCVCVCVCASSSFFSHFFFLRLKKINKKFIFRMVRLNQSIEREREETGRKRERENNATTNVNS